MADIYCDADAAGGGDGSEGTPYNDLATAAAALSNGDTLHLQGTFSGIQTTVTVTEDNLTIQQWVGQTAAEIRGDTVIASGDWTDNADGTFYATVSGASTVRAVLWNYDANVDGSGRNYGFLAVAASQAACAAADASYFHDTGANRLYVNPPAAGANPDTGDTYAYCLGNNGLTLSGCTGCTVSGLTIRLFPYYSSGLGLGINLTGTTSCTVTGCSVWDCGYHNIQIAGSSGANNVVTGCTLGGGSVVTGTSAATLGVHYSDAAAGVTGGRVSNCTFHLYSALGADGNPLAASANIIGWFTHTSGGAETVNDLEISGCTFTGYQANCEPIDGANSGAIGNVRDWRTYPVRMVDCTGTGLGRMSIENTAAMSVGFARCNLKFSRDGTSPLVKFGAGAITIKCCFEACSLWFTKTSSATVHTCMLLGVSSEVYFLNCTLADATPTARKDLNDIFIQFANTGATAGLIEMYGCAIIRGEEGRFVGNNPTADGDVANTAHWVSQGNVYIGIEDTAGFCNQAGSYRTRSSWDGTTTTIDADVANAGIARYYDADQYATDNLGLTDFSTGDMTPTAAGNIRQWTTTRGLLTYRAVTGLNGKAYGGQYGAYQYGGGGFRSRARDFRSR